ncbi:MAG: precorrin-6Y C5,15-methyltransferase (decarboxylating) subunit CbiT [Methanobacteriota archaeon]|nr:MAG: precorrin-6Y C5,15-methyltransferase (decarboxylating) subunit CbiT [Euryarchaeota archaeon]
MRDSCRPPGLPDELFIRGEAPMTRQEVRAVTLSKACIGREDTVFDIGAGTGSISVEAALLAERGMVYAIERRADRAEVIRENRERFGCANMEVIVGEAPSAMEGLPRADRIIIGGSGGRIEEILRACPGHLKKGGLVLVNAVTLDTLCRATAGLEELGFRLEATQLSVTRLVGDRGLMKASSQVWIIRGWSE